MYSIAKCIEMRQKRVWVWVLAIIGGIPWGYLVMGMYLPAHIGYSALGKTEPEYFAMLYISGRMNRDGIRNQLHN